MKCLIHNLSINDVNLYIFNYKLILIFSSQAFLQALESLQSQACLAICAFTTTCINGFSLFFTEISLAKATSDLSNTTCSPLSAFIGLDLAAVFYTIDQTFFLDTAYLRDSVFFFIFSFSTDPFFLCFIMESPSLLLKLGNLQLGTLLLIER